ncbi:hypothetical protein F3Y22_tig00111234pilonHSYRG00084 [Hibiscus syriacus]|uniref:Protein phosphatase 1 regulatory subunit pprA n=1 Tax=Hibiscus syriacus TaxID=106335 RepID=A0A6A2YTZ3_HIBSY|nr:hypothetical protein F3Y22_tig00111234pilonHSYRG00084 [Hibiscus syriacus]
MQNQSTTPPEANAERDDETVEMNLSSINSLDFTCYQLRDLDSVELPPNLTELDLTTNRLTSLDPRIANLIHLKKLFFRQNLFNDSAIEPISHWDSLSGLEELILRDNKLTKIPDVGIFKKLLIFDVSFNEIASLKGLSEASSTIKELYVSKNEVTKMEEVGHLHELQILELGSNRLRECIALEEIYLSHNGISKMEGLSKLVNLRVLDVSTNKLTSVDDIQNLTRLEDLWLNDNKIESLDGLAEAVSGSREKLTTIYLENNPCVWFTTCRL